MDFALPGHVHTGVSGEDCEKILTWYEADGRRIRATIEEL